MLQMGQPGVKPPEQLELTSTGPENELPLQNVSTPSSGLLRTRTINLGVSQVLVFICDPSIIWSV